MSPAAMRRDAAAGAVPVGSAPPWRPGPRRARPTPTTAWTDPAVPRIVASPSARGGGALPVPRTDPGGPAVPVRAPASGSGAPLDATLERTAEIFGALATASRLRILLVLTRGETRVKELVAATGLSQTLVSQHLRTLRALRLVRVRRCGREAFYAIADQHVLGIAQAALAHVAEDLTHS